MVQKFVLGEICILEFINQYMLKLLGVLTSYECIFRQEPGCPQKQVIKIERIADQQQLLVARINPFHHFIAIILGNKFIR